MLEYHEYMEKHEQDEFGRGIHALIEKEVENRVKEKAAQYANAISKYQQLREQNALKDQQIEHLEKNLSDAQTFYTKQGKDNAEREMLGGYKLSDGVWIIQNTYKRVDCPTCLGKKKLDVDLHINKKTIEINCPDCSGYGTKSTNTQNAEHGVIKEIECHTWADGRQKEVNMYVSIGQRDSIRVHMNQFFKTKEECEAQIRENEKIVKRKTTK